MIFHRTTAPACAVIAIFLCSFSASITGVLASRHADPLYSGAGARAHGYRSDLAAAVIAHNNKLRAAAARVAAAGSSGPEDVDAVSGFNSDSGVTASAGGTNPGAATASVPSECVSLASTHSCDPWTVGYHINTTELSLVYGLEDGLILDAAYWDKLVKAMTSGGDLQSAIWAEWAQCLGYRGAPIQYYLSYVCLTDIFFYSAGCNPGATISPPLQPDVCDVYKEAVAGLVEDPNACPTLETLSESLQDDALQDVFDRRSSLLNADESCRAILNTYGPSAGASVWGVTADQMSCGFGGNVTVAGNYCQDVFEQFHQKPKCCDSLGGDAAASSASSFAPPGRASRLRTDSLKALPAAAEGATTSSDGEGVPVAPIVGGVLGGVVVIGGSVAAFLVYGKRNQSTRKAGKAVQPLSSVSTSGANGMQQVTDLSTSGADYVTLPPGTRFVGILEFQPTNPDEMEVNEGDIIEGKIQFSDGWMKGYNHESQETGLFPSAVVKPLNS